MKNITINLCSVIIELKVKEHLISRVKLERVTDGKISEEKSQVQSCIVELVCYSLYLIVNDEQKKKCAIYLLDFKNLFQVTFLLWL
jgi:hypothetical protein